MDVVTAYTSQRNELSDVPLVVSAGTSIPAWIQGTLYRNGPGLFELGSETVKHWFDGQAMHECMNSQ